MSRKKETIVLIQGQDRVSGSQTFPVRHQVYFNAKHKILICIEFCGRLQIVWRTNSGPRSRHQDTVEQVMDTFKIKDPFEPHFEFIINLYYQFHGSIDPIFQNQKAIFITQPYFPYDFVRLLLNCSFFAKTTLTHHLVCKNNKAYRKFRYN